MEPRDLVLFSRLDFVDSCLGVEGRGLEPVFSNPAMQLSTVISYLSDQTEFSSLL